MPKHAYAGPGYHQVRRGPINGAPGTENLASLILEAWVEKCHNPALSSFVKRCEGRYTSSDTVEIKYVWANYNDFKNFVINNANCFSEVLCNTRDESRPNVNMFKILFEYDGCEDKHDEILIRSNLNKMDRSVLWHRISARDAHGHEAENWYPARTFISEILENEGACKDAPGGVRVEDRSALERPPSTRVAEYDYEYVKDGMSHSNEALGIARAGVLAMIFSLAMSVILLIIPVETTAVALIPVLGICFSSLLFYAAGRVAGKGGPSDDQGRDGGAIPTSGIQKPSLHA
jgi:hypothetical protein